MANIGIINSTYRVGSTGRIAYELQQFINNNSEHFAKAYFGRGKKTNTHEAFNFSLPLSVAIHGVLSRVFDRTAFYSSFSTKRLIKKMKEDQINTVFLINLHGYYLNIRHLFKFFKQNNIKVYYSLEDCWSFTGHCSHFSIFNCNKWKTECKKCEHLNQYPKSILFDASTKNFREKKNLFLSVNPTLILPCKWLLNVVKESFFKNQRMVVVRNGVDTDVFRKVKNDFRLKNNLINKKIILCISQYWIEKKGIFDILDLSKKIGSDYVIVLVGKLNVDIVLPSNIFHIDHTETVEEIVDIYSSADVFFNPTYEDTYPTVNIEALACELPIVCYRTGGAIESVDNAYIVDQGDIENSYRLLKELCENPHKYHSPNICFSKTDTYKEYLRLIDE